jgi:hypothetical protein
MYAVTYGQTHQHILCLSSQHFDLQSVATCVLLLTAICYFTFCASAVSRMDFRVWHCVWSYITVNSVPQQSAVLVSVCGKVCAATYIHTLQNIIRVLTFQGQGQSPPSGLKKKQDYPGPSSEMDTNASFPHFFLLTLEKLYFIINVQQQQFFSFTMCQWNTGGGVSNPPPHRNSEVLTKLSQIPSSVENTSVTT